MGGGEGVGGSVGASVGFTAIIPKQQLEKCNMCTFPIPQGKEYFNPLRIESYKEAQPTSNE